MAIHLAYYNMLYKRKTRYNDTLYRGHCRTHFTNTSIRTLYIDYTCKVSLGWVDTDSPRTECSLLQLSDVKVKFFFFLQDLS